MNERLGETVVIALLLAATPGLGACETRLRNPPLEGTPAAAVSGRAMAVPSYRGGGNDQGFDTTEGRVMQRVAIAGRDAYCSDGSPAAMYLAASETGSDKWLIYLEEGGVCWSGESCASRQTQTPYRTGSGGLPDEMVFGGIFSDSESLNPAFARYNKAFVHYCSSDGWMGDRAASTEAAGLSFRGADIVRAAVSMLAAGHGTFPPLRRASQIVVAGSSAGGQGALFHAHELAHTFGPTRVSVVAEGSYGYVARLERPTEAEYFPPEIAQSQDMISFWGVERPRHCPADMSTALCLSDAYSIRLAHHHVFITFNMDGFSSMSPEAQQLRRRIADEAASFAGTSIFSSSRNVHIALPDSFQYRNLVANRVALNRALAIWLRGSSEDWIERDPPNPS